MGLKLRKYKLYYHNKFSNELFDTQLNLIVETCINTHDYKERELKLIKVVAGSLVLILCFFQSFKKKYCNRLKVII